MLKFLPAIILALIAANIGQTARAAERAPDLILRGAVAAADHQTYREVPFKVPAGVTRLTLSFDYSGKAQHTTIDLGLRDPQRLRGWSGGNKARVTVAETDATPSYLPGPLPAGVWRLVLGVPNIRKTETATYQANIWFDRGPEPFAGFAAAAINPAPGWYRGDLHMHSGHSDGACLSRRGVKVACPVFRTLESARARGLDFIAVTDHNATSQSEALRELAPYFDDLLLIPGREITTFQGHANVFGPVASLDFQLGSARAPDLAAILDEVEAAHGLISINHPAMPSGEACMGCGWTAPNTPFARFAAIEAVNGGALLVAGRADGPLSGIPFWEARLYSGQRITAIGGSDNHDAGLDAVRASAIGVPTTVVHAQALDQTSILAAIRAGHVFIDVEGSRDRLLEVEATAGAARAEMGDVLAVGAGPPARIGVHVVGVPGGRLVASGDGAALIQAVGGDRPLDGPDTRRDFILAADGAVHWLRFDVRDAAGKLLLLGNPIYLRPAGPDGPPHRP
ncbi:CehA/McbA family metallohydrolase [Phenylobacterium aquaticum]|uniref:CehA/McbA family metallohydrolase n=2 Tax=Phenylobacterium aquaticum TaxID=1763816 RepID=UPI0026EAD33C|nr:CehA/McbA family metallohydrolase [Phenylobacterium aquaticum]